MVIQSITICTKLGKVLVGRQYTNIGKLQYEEMIKTFPKQIQDNQQHTFIESNNQRFIYLPIENLYLLLITSKNSNIIDDLETIRVLHRILVDNCKDGASEQQIISNAFNFLLIFDDVVSFGYRESVTQEQVEEYLKMQSNEESLQNMLKIVKENEAKEMAKKFIRDKANDSSKQLPVQQFQENIKSQIIVEQKRQPEVQFSTSKFSKKQGLILGQKKVIQQTVIEKIQQIEEPVQQQQFNPLSSAINIDIIEQLNCQISKEGGLQLFEIIGEIQLKCNDQSKLKLGVELSRLQQKNIQLKPHPNLNKQLWNSQNILCAKSESFPFNQNLSSLKYKYNTQDSKQIPFIFNYWFNENSITLELEYNQTELFQNLQNLELIVQFPFNSEVESVENSEYKYQDDNLNWYIQELSDNVQNCNIVINFEQNVSINQCFPIQVNLNQEKTISGFNVIQVLNLEDQSQVKFEEKHGLKSNEFFIV